MDEKLIFLDVPLLVSPSQSLFHPEIHVNNESEDNSEWSNISFGELAGGLQLATHLQKHNIYWRTCGNVLELFEYISSTEMQKMECRVIFEQAQIIPGMKLVDDGNWLFILVATSNCVYRIQLPMPRQKDRYLLSGLSSSLFDDDQNRFKLPFTDAVLCTSSCVSDSSACFVLALQSGDLAFIKLLERGKGSCNVVKKNSRISKIWSGLNPWAAGEAVECPDDLVICDVMKRDFKAVGICKDHRLRIWSCKRLDCEAQFDITKYQNNNPSVLGQHHKIRMKCGAAGSCFISVAFSLGLDSVFINFKLDATIPTIQHISTIHCFESANHNLVDYQLTSDRLLWGLWRDADDQPILSVCDITIQTWHEVAMMHSPPSDVSLQYNTTMDEQFLTKVLGGRLCLKAIHKSLAMVHQSIRINPAKKSIQADIIKIIQSQNHSEDNKTNLQDKHPAWSTFYTSCLQYHAHSSKAIALSESDTWGPSIIRKGYVSQLVGVPLLEAVCRGADPSVLKRNRLEDCLHGDLVKLVRSIAMLATVLGRDYLDEMAEMLQLCNNPVTFIKESLEDIKEALSAGCDDFDLEDSMSGISDIPATLRYLLDSLEPNITEHDLGSCPPIQCDYVMQLLLSSTRQIVEDRLQLTILLLIMSSLFEDLRDSFPSRVAIYVRAYSSIVWMVTAEKEHLNASLEMSIKSLSFCDEKSSLLIESFVRGDGGRLISAALCQNFSNFNGQLENIHIPTAVSVIIQLLWPLGPTLSFPEFLFASRQFGPLLHYINDIVVDWCEFCPKYTTYMLAHCHLHFGNYNKALRLFIHVGGDAGGDEMIINRVLQIDDQSQMTQREIQVLYFTKVLSKFEKLGLHEQVIALATHAVGKAASNDPNLPILCSSLFRQTLQLERYDEAYQAILLNPNREHRKDCLRTMVVAMCERGEYKRLIEHSYDSMLNDLVSILDHRARSSDIFNKFYDILFSFHVYRGNYRRAALAMYEKSCRLQHVPPNPTTLHLKQMCLITTISSLQLVDCDNQWLLLPMPANQVLSHISQSPKHITLKEPLSPHKVQPKPCIVELKQLQNELLLLEARIKLMSDVNELKVGVGASANETVTLLVHNSFFNDAFVICEKFQLKKQIVFEALCTRCIHASYLNDDAQVRTWLRKNSRSGVHLRDEMWWFMKDSLEVHGDVSIHKSLYYRAVLETMLSYSFPLPAWFLNYYKQLNCAELLRMLMCYDWLELSTRISIEFLEALQGVRPDQFALKSSLVNHGKQVWHPRNEILQLLELLEDMASHGNYSELLESLESTYEGYLNKIKDLV